MKQAVLFITLFLLPTLIALPSSEVTLDAYVKDYAGVLSPSETTELTQVLQAIKDSGKAETAVVIIDSLEGQDVLGYAQSVAEGNLGNKENNGLLLLVSIQDREYRFHTGRGIEAELPDILLGRISREQLLPAFREEAYGVGIINAMLSVQAHLEGTQLITADTSSDAMGQAGQDFMMFSMIFTLVFIIISIILFATVNKEMKNQKGKHKGGKYSHNELFTAAMLASMLRRGGGGNFRGGFGGFGGGSFGGGGAGGGW